MITQERLTQAEIAMQEAQSIYNAALVNYQSSNWWKSAGLKAKVESAKAAAEDAKQEYYALLGADAAEEYTSNTISKSSSSLIPVVIIGVIALTVAILIIFK